jgi:hypothetical protein
MALREHGIRDLSSGDLQGLTKSASRGILPPPGASAAAFSRSKPILHIELRLPALQFPVR